MKAVCLLVVLVALVAMAMAGTHHYKVPASQTHEESSHGGSFFDRLANGLDNGVDLIGSIIG